MVMIFLSTCIMDECAMVWLGVFLGLFIYLEHGWVCDGWGGGLLVRVPTCSLFHDENFSIFDFVVRGTP